MNFGNQIVRADEKLASRFKQNIVTGDHGYRFWWGELVVETVSLGTFFAYFAAPIY